jgi:uncharacterized protein YjbJ (UPF0337 family)
LGRSFVPNGSKAAVDTGTSLADCRVLARSNDMNWDTIEGKWDQFKGDVKGKWAKLTDDDVSHVGAKKDKLVGKLQERYGIMKDEAERQVDGWIASIKEPKQPPPAV